MRNSSVTLAICRIAIAFVWIYQGIFPKLLGPHPDEIAMGMAFGLTEQDARLSSYASGAMEIVFGLLVLWLYRMRWPYVVTAAAVVLFLFTAVYAPQWLYSAFNSTTLNLTVFALSIVALAEITRLESNNSSFSR
ncbi:MAG TPA: DoxX-like family protein [Methylophilaceae bacterium]|jgi:uncharacterized membrane protein YphA (DoxX/SURF4 family)|nr:DoxX-like family protein [Methylophilaceae bacterium]